MSFEQATYSFSYPSGLPPTPTKTPTSASFVQSFETPKQESSFYDPRVTWNTADPWAESPDFLKTPKYYTFSTPVKSPTRSSGNKRPFSSQNIEEQIASHVHHLSPNPDQSLPPVEPSRRLSSSPNPSSTTKRPCHRASEAELTPLKTSLEEQATSSMRSAGSMQTPPPTSTSASRRKIQQAQAAKLTRQPGTTGRRMSSPGFVRGDNAEPTLPLVEASPGFPSLQFSPEVFSFPHSGPATAPVFPQQKLFWDPEQSHDAMSIDFSANDGFALGIGIDKSLDPFVSSLDPNTPSRLPLASFHALEGSQDDLAIFPVSAKMPAKKFSKSRLTASVVNPSMLFSSPSHPSELSNIPSSQADIDSTLQPYAHQIQDAEREIELLGPRKSKRRKGTEVDSPAVKEALATLRDDDTDRPSSKRSITDSVLQSFDDRHVRAALKERKAIETQRRLSMTRPQRDRRLSPYKSAQSPQRRTTLTLTIDSTGRAKTETKVVTSEAGPSSESRMDLDSASEQDDSTTSSSEDMDIATSQRQSFGFAKKKSKRGKLTRFALDSKSHSQKSSYASTFASSSTLSATKSTKQRVISNLSMHFDDPSLLPLPPSDDRASSSTVISDRLDGRDNHESDTGTTVDSDDGKGDAQSELKKIRQQRQRSKNRQASQATPQKNRGFQYPNPLSTNSLPPFSYGGSLTPNHGGNDPFNISPTTITDPDLTTPNSAHDSHVSTESTRCVCRGTESDGDLMILWYGFSLPPPRKRKPKEARILTCVPQQRILQKMAPCPLRRPQPQESTDCISLRLLHGEHAECEGRTRAEDVVSEYGESVGGEGEEVEVTGTVLMTDGGMRVGCVRREGRGKKGGQGEVEMECERL
ncbi:MAG: hypothetical protein Q9170_006580 [Blastenia crenularia]